MKSCKSYEKNETKNFRLLVFSSSPKNLAFWRFLFCFFMWFARFQIFNMWTEKHLAKASCIELTLRTQPISVLKSFLLYTYSVCVLKCYNAKRTIFYFQVNFFFESMKIKHLSHKFSSQYNRSNTSILVLLSCLYYILQFHLDYIELKL